MRRLAKIIVALRFVLVPLWVVGAVLAVVYLPSIRQTQTAEIGAVPLPKDAPALQAELLSKTHFPFPLLTRYVVVLRDEDGLAPETLAEAAETVRTVRGGASPA